jgi:hypothetical protein
VVFFLALILAFVGMMPYAIRAHKQRALRVKRYFFGGEREVSYALNWVCAGRHFSEAFLSMIDSAQPCDTANPALALRLQSTRNPGRAAMITSSACSCAPRSGLAFQEKLDS